MKQIFFYILPLLLVLIGCRDDYEEGDHFPVSKEGKVQVPFSISMPAQLPKTYALDENDENEVRSIDILLKVMAMTKPLLIEHKPIKVR